MANPPSRWFNLRVFDGDSLDLIERVMQLEEKYGPIPPDVVAGIRSMDDLHRYCQQRLGEVPR